MQNSRMRNPSFPAGELCLQPSSLKPPLCRLTSRAKPTRLVRRKKGGGPWIVISTTKGNYAITIAKKRCIFEILEGKRLIASSGRGKQGLQRFSAREPTLSFMQKCRPLMCAGVRPSQSMWHVDRGRHTGSRTQDIFMSCIVNFTRQLVCSPFPRPCPGPWSFLAPCPHLPPTNPLECILLLLTIRGTFN
uniref:HDC09977 n=1 Tax=Drosophila melanogaster TaxID=7227 RepID=Q6IL97_DROME|nr:TPA_inf: HDC09977 [Drosophila melanogaster]